MCKKIRKNTCFLLVALLCVAPLQARVSTYVGAYGQIGEWSLLPSGSDYSPSFGVAGGLGGVVELQIAPKYSPTAFLLDVGIGAWGGMTSFSVGQKERFQIPGKQYDLQGESFDFIYELSGRKDNYSNLAVQVPLMVGVQHRRFYMLAGMKIGINAWTQAASKASVMTAAKYEDSPLYTGMPLYQWFEDERVSSRNSTNLNIDLDVSLEVGGRIGVINDAHGFDVPDRKIEYRLAGFFDFGLTDIHKAGTNMALTMPDRYDAQEAYGTHTMIDGLHMNDIMSTAGFASAVRSMTIGLKFTVLFRMPDARGCVLCNENYRRTVGSGGSRSRMKYEE